MIGQLDVEVLRESASGQIGAALYYLPEVGSTNRILREWPAGPLRHGTVVITDFQSQGRGRQGRSWRAPPGTSLLLSIAIRWPEGVALARSVMLATLAVRDAIRQETELQCELKWPNDLLLGGKKVCGILAENGRSVSSGFVILGIGVNCNFDPRGAAGIPPTATTLQAELGRPIERERLAGELFRQLEVWYRSLNEDPLTVFTAWASSLHIEGRLIVIDDTVEVWEGIAMDVRPDGALVVRERDGGTRLVYAANVSVREEPGDFTTR